MTALGYLRRFRDATEVCGRYRSADGAEALLAGRNNVETWIASRALVTAGAGTAADSDSVSTVADGDLIVVERWGSPRHVESRRSRACR